MKFIIKIYLVLLMLAAVSCTDILDLEPTDKITAEDLFSDPAGTKLFLADLYDRLPIEDLTFFTKQGFNYNMVNPNNAGVVNAMHTMEAVHVEGRGFIENNSLNWWTSPTWGKNSEEREKLKNQNPWALLRDVNTFFQAIPTLNVTDDQKDLYKGEASFIRAFTYFGLVKRYGGVPIMTEPLIYEGDVSKLLVPRSTEKDTWDFVLSQCDSAITYLSDVPDTRRANKWTALALKSRASLHAASIAKFGENADILVSSDAVQLGLVGIDPSEANNYYQAAIDASYQIMTEGPFTLYKPEPASPEDASENYRQMFEDPNLAVNSEAIFIKGRVLPGDGYANNYDIWYTPNQTRNSWPHPGRMNPTLDFVDAFESYDNPGQSSPVVTTEDGDFTNYLGFDPARNYLQFDNPGDIFLNKDARLHAMVVIPGSEWRGKEIVIQAGFVRPDGNAIINTLATVNVDGVEYYTYGSPTADTHSGFDPSGNNHTLSGFSFKKFLNSGDVIGAWNQSTTDFMEFRYAEVLLNYAEAVAESGLGDALIAQQAINDIRKRAGHDVDIPLSIENVMRERFVELAFENKNTWDLMRRREYHLYFDNTVRHALLPLLDLRGPTPKYIFVRSEYLRDAAGPKTFNEKHYYRNIPGTGLNGLVNNPEW